MKIVEFENQSGEEWLSWRRDGIGASDIGVLMGSNLFKTPLQLWNIKCGYTEEEPINRAMLHGIKNEERVRQKMNHKFGLDLKPLCIEDSENPYMKASLDGFDSTELVLGEIKCPISESILDCARNDQTVPSYWLDQVQWQIMLAEPKRAFIVLWDYRTDEDIVIDVSPLPERIDEMRKMAKQFWSQVQRGEPPRAQKGDFLQRDDDPLKNLLTEYCDHYNQEKLSKKHKEKVKEKIVSICEGKDVKCDGWTISESAPRISYDIELMRIRGIDVDSFRKTSTNTISYRITAPRASKKG